MNTTQTQLPYDSQEKRESDRPGRVRPLWLATSLIVTALMILLTVLAIRGGSSYPGQAPQYRYVLDDLVDWIAPRRQTICFILSILAGVFLYVRIGNGLFSKIYTGAAAVLIPPLAFMLVEAYNRGFWHVGAPLSYKIAEPFSSMFLLNLLLYYLFYLALAFLCGSFRIGYSIVSVLLMLVAVVNSYVVKFRGSPIVPWDLLSVRTAGNVAGNYDYTVTWQMVLATFGFIFLILVSVKMNARLRIFPVRLAGAALALGALLFVVSGLQEDEMKTFWGVDTTLFTPNVRYTKNGFWPAFLSNLSFLNVEKPEGYSAGKAREIGQEAQDSYEAGEGAAAASVQKPNIIVIMNEAFSDLSVLGDFSTSEDYMPGFRALMEEYTSGHLMVSVKGGNTANTEYECLSSDSMAFLPPGCVVFQQYIHSSVPTIATHLKSLGYRTTGMHPYNGSGWERDRVYPLMGFDEFLDISDFQGADKLRNYVSDKGAYDKIIDIFESKPEDESEFIFLVTMQNHSGYTPKNTDNGFTEEVMLTDAPLQTGDVVATERYLTLIKYSDQAFTDLIDYFEKNVDEPTVIAMFGDHEPGDYITDVIDRLVGNESFDTASDNSGAAGTTQESLEGVQKHYMVPYVIWNNFGASKREDAELISANYLCPMILEDAGVELNAYQKFLLEMREQVPAIAAGAYVDAGGVFHSWSGEDQDKDRADVLTNYNILQYNHLNDTENRVEDLFSIRIEE